MEEVNASKNAGNDFFKACDYASAIGNYTNGIELCKKLVAVPVPIDSDCSSSSCAEEVLSSLYCNRAACYIKVINYEMCIKDCEKALEISPGLVKALYRLSLAHSELGDFSSAAKSLSKLLHVDSKNREANTLMIKVKQQAMRNKGDINSEVSAILSLLKGAGVDTGDRLGKSAMDDAELQKCLKGLVALLYDDKHHTLEFARKDGVGIMSDLFPPSSHPSVGTGTGTRSNDESSEFVLRVLSCAASHKEFASSFVCVSPVATLSPERLCGDGGFAFKNNYNNGNGNGNGNNASSSYSSSLLSLGGVCRLLLRPSLPSACRRHVILLVMTIVRSLPPYTTTPGESTTSDATSTDNIIILNYLKEVMMKELFISFLHVMESCSADALGQDSALLFTLCADGIAALLSEHVDYFTPSAPIDLRMETLDERKSRFRLINYVKERCRGNASLLIDLGLLRVLVRCLEGGLGDTVGGGAMRKRSVECIGRVIKGVDDDERMKAVLVDYVPLLNSEYKQLNTVDATTLSSICRRAEITAAVCATRPELGVWLFERPGGCDHVIFMAARGDAYCQEVAAEVLCLLSSTAGGPALLAPVIPSGVLELLLRSPVPGVKVAAAAAMLKLSLKAKALREDSPEISAILNTASAVLKAAITGKGTGKAEAASAPTSLVSFSSIDDSYFNNTSKRGVGEGGDKVSNSSSSSSSSSSGLNCSSDMASSVERAVEMVAALVGRSHLKDEIVHGSYRVASLVDALLSVGSSSSSGGGGTTAAYGILHILSSLSVTNEELRQKALAEKGITAEQYEKMQELQRIKTEDEKGDFVGEMPSESSSNDSDSGDKCMLRIKRLVAAGAISYCVGLLSDAPAGTSFLSDAAKETCCRALRQICVCESVRGSMVQQGGLRACCAVAMDSKNTMATRLEAAHAVAKALVTTNPHLMSEHLRVGLIGPLLLLCRENEASNLQQFEALLSLTNLVSCGEMEQNKFVAEKGVRSVHYLMFSDHNMVQRAATEVLCNISYHDEVIAIMRKSDQVRLWLGMCEAFELDNESELVGDINNYKSIAKASSSSSSSGAQGSDAVTTPSSNAKDEKESLKTAKAAAGTLAGALGDAEVCMAVMQEDFSTALLRLFLSRNLDLIHRALVMTLEFVSSGADGSIRYIRDNKIDVVLKEVVSSIVSAHGSLQGLYDRVMDSLKSRALPTYLST